MRPEDVRQVIEIAASLPEAPHWPESAYGNALDEDAAPQRIALVAEHPQAVLSGFLITVLIPPLAELETIAVAKQAHRQGIATRLLNELLTRLQKKQITEVMLEVRQSNHAGRVFYASVGFTETGRRTGYYNDPKEDAILLSRPLKGVSGERRSSESE
jgi:[ribosomal protein S18]-alanine N-acetyltransferase